MTITTDRPTTDAKPPSRRVRGAKAAGHVGRRGEGGWALGRHDPLNPTERRRAMFDKTECGLHAA